MSKLSERLRREFERSLKSRVISLAAVREGEQNAAELKTVNQLILEGHDPLHAVYANTCNLISVFIENVTCLPLMDRARRFMVKAEDLYTPGYPPMSPITQSYYNDWTFFDVAHGSSQETLGSCYVEVSDLLGLNGLQIEAARNLCQSRTGIYTVLQGNGSCFRLRELVTGHEVEATIPTAFKGKPGALVYIRLLPPLAGAPTPHVAMTTPYVLVGVREARWIDYFQRHQIIADTVGFEERLYRHLKDSPDHYYWSEFAFYGYVNYRADAIFLAGFPDCPETQSCHPKFDPNTLNHHLAKAAMD